MPRRWVVIAHVQPRVELYLEAERRQMFSWLSSQQIVRRRENKDSRLLVHFPKERVSPQQLAPPLLLADEACADPTFDQLLRVGQGAVPICTGRIADHHELNS